MYCANHYESGGCFAEFILSESEGLSTTEGVISDTSHCTQKFYVILNE